MQRGLLLNDYNTIHISSGSKQHERKFERGFKFPFHAKSLWPGRTNYSNEVRRFCFCDRRLEPAPTSIIGTMTDPKPFYNAKSSRWAHAQAWNNIYCWAHFLEKATRHPQDPWLCCIGSCGGSMQTVTLLQPPCCCSGFQCCLEIGSNTILCYSWVL